ncbi:pantetheine-phosphate adenylyltransferase [bacterium]|nr:pantetheine-phosphate adenylyltransferase [bacterium]
MTAVFPGSFDPITKGHEDVIRRAVALFDTVWVAVGTNANKQYMFTEAQRLGFIRDTFADEPRVQVEPYSGLTADYMKHKGVQFLLRGLRNPADFEFEKAIAHANRKLMPSMETVFFLTSSGLSYVSSSIVRDVIRNGGDYTLFVPDAVRLKG